MTILGTYSYFSPEIADCFSEAFEMAGIDPSTAGSDHIDSIIRSMKFMLNSEWHTIGMRQWMIERYNQAMTSVNTTTPTFDLPTGGIDIMNAVLVRNSRASPMYKMSREEYLEIPDKTVLGRPTRYFCDRRYDKVTVYTWQLPSQTTDIMMIDYFKQMSQPGNMSNTLQMPPHVLDAFIHGLAARVAQKFNQERFAQLQLLYWGANPEKPGGKLARAMSEDRDRADVKLTIGLRR